LGLMFPVPSSNDWQRVQSGASAKAVRAARQLTDPDVNFLTDAPAGPYRFGTLLGTD
jgi:hypothetical protein